jgi:hypothetical protein
MVAAAMNGLGGERNCPRSGESLREHRQRAEVGMERDPFDSADAERSKAVLVLEPPEGALDGGAATVQVAPSLRLTRDKRVEAVSP